ncbi:MAG: HAMP domain-containing protein [Lachnospiraceae bacterium]|nr:HAMP domain-containing protein [Lachnospiraceae bacterium]
MKKSIRVRMTLILTISIAATILMCWIINKTFLVQYYQYSKMQTLHVTYEEVDRLVAKIVNHTFDKTQEEEADKISSDNGVGVYIFTERLETVYQSNYKRQEVASMLTSIQCYMYGVYSEFDGSRIELLDSMDNRFNIYQMHDGALKLNYIDLFGRLDNGYWVFIRTNLESIQESVGIANKFLAYVGIIATIIATFVMFIISRRFTKPILELAGIAKKMSELDFDAKYKVTSEDEIGELGNSFNILSSRLEHTISELKSANNELESDIQKKVQIDEMRKEFLSNVTHELKTPIALIQGYAEGLKENINDDSESRDFYCEVIIDEAMKMNKMVKKLLSLNQIESGANQVEFERFDIVSLIRSVLSSVDILVKQKDITIHFTEEDPIYVWADEYMIEEVVTNYISNAINHIDGARIIEVKCIQKEDVVRVAVFNTGENIPKEDLDKVWIKFFKVDKARTREYGGSGIGLSIVKAIMTSHNRECGVINHEYGVEFWFELDTKIN